VSTHVDIAVIGSGAAGIAAAVSAARAGCSTLILASGPAPGGTGGFSGLTTLCGLYDDAGKFLNEGFSHQFAEALAEIRVLPVVERTPSSGHTMPGKLVRETLV